MASSAGKFPCRDRCVAAFECSGIGFWQDALSERWEMHTKGKMKKASDSVVSVCMITFNHERFVAQAIESVLMQEADFPVELVIGEDCSTDGTRAICERYAWAHPDCIRLLPSERNLGMVANARRTRQACRGKYIANLEGDDYWTDSQKLQRQVAILEGDPTLAATYTNAKVIYDDGAETGHDLFQTEPIRNRRAMVKPLARTTIRDLAMGNYIHFSTCMYRRTPETEFLPWLDDCGAPDWAVCLSCARQGDLGYENRITTVYRVHAGGVWSSKTLLQLSFSTWRQYGVLLKSPEMQSIRPDLLLGRERFRIVLLNTMRGHLCDCLVGGKGFRRAWRALNADWPEDLDLTRKELHKMCADAHEQAFYNLYWAGRRGAALRIALRMGRYFPSWWLQRSSLGVVMRALRDVLTASIL